MDEVTQIPPAFSTGLGVLYSTDCLNLLAALKDESIDCVFADPPFNLGKDYGNGADRDALDCGSYLAWRFSWIDQCIRVVKRGGSL
jgi:site-specific DNA-methyltransferase (adenine-specific)